MYWVGLQRSLNTGSNRIRIPRSSGMVFWCGGNSTRKQACPSHVARILSWLSVKLLGSCSPQSGLCTESDLLQFTLHRTGPHGSGAFRTESRNPSFRTGQCYSDVVFESLKVYVRPGARVYFNVCTNCVQRNYGWKGNKRLTNTIFTRIGPLFRKE